MNGWHLHFVRFAAVGIGSNLLLYVIYLALTALGLGHKSAMSGLYLLGLAQTFFLNKTWTFAHEGRTRTAVWRYLIAYAFGFSLNWVALHVLVDSIGLPHQVVQALAIPAVALTMFLIQRHWVFALHVANLPLEERE